MAHNAKSYNTDDVQVQYTITNSLRFHPLQQKLMDDTLAKAKLALMLGAPEVLQLGSNVIKMIHAKRVLDIGTFTGASALAWSLALPADGQVHTMDVMDGPYNEFGRPIIESDKTVASKIKVYIQPALQTLDKFIADGESGKFDFAFIDADKENYQHYYERALKLLRSGGVIMVDNAIWSGSVCKKESEMEPSTLAIHKLNQHIHKDQRVDSSLITTGDGVNIVVKK